MFEYFRDKKRILVILVGILAIVSTCKGIINAYDSSMDFIYSYAVEALTNRSYSCCQPAFTFWIMFFWGFVSENAAKIGWLIFNLIFTVIIAYVLRKTFFKNLAIEDYMILIFLMIAGGPWRTNLSNAQYKLAMFAFFMLAYYFSDMNREILGGLMLSLCMFQYQMAIPLAVIFFYRKKYKTIISAGAFLLISLIGTSIWLKGIYNASLRQVVISSTLSEAGDVDIESILHCGQYTVLIFLTGVVLLMIFAYILPEGNDKLFISASLLTSWFCAYQRIYCFFPAILILEYALEKMRDKRTGFYKIMFVSTLAFTIICFFARTISEDKGLVLERIVFYFMFVIYCIEIIKHLKGVASIGDERM